MAKANIFLPDTNIFILGFQQGTIEAEFLDEIISKGNLYISVVVVSEFLANADNSEIMNFEKLLNTFIVLPVDTEVAIQAAEYRRQSLKKKRSEMLDCFLAAQAKLNNLTLVTNDKSDFPMKDIKVITP